MPARKTGRLRAFYENGNLKAKGSYKGGKLDGEHLLYYPGGKLMSKSVYKNGKLDGPVIDYSRDGVIVASASFVAGELENVRVFDGKETIVQHFKKGLPNCPRLYGELQEALATINLAPVANAGKGGGLDSERTQALRRLQSYRALVGVPYEGLVLTAEMNKYADAGAEICQAIDRLDHNPPNPNWAEDRYQFALKATRSSNLAASSRALTMESSVDMYMNDSDAGNIDRVGHRRWCINPAMQTVGFGKSPSGKFAAMMAHDRSRKDVPDYDFVAFPPAGLVPPGFFKADYAWSISPNPAKFKSPNKTQVKIIVANKTDSTPDKPGSPMKLNFSNVETGGYGSGPAIIFRPEGLSVAPGSRYIVKIEGLQSKSGQTTTLEYLVWFTMP